jgi:hypothetical protein
VGRRPLEGYRGGLRDKDLPQKMRASLWMSSGGLASMLDGGLLKTARPWRLLGGCR